jgi:hypothetical protein
MGIDLENPFGLDDFGNLDTGGGNGTGENVQLGNWNDASPNDCTKIMGTAANNAALLIYNKEKDYYGVGLYALSWSKCYGIGSAGGAIGVGVYGITPKGVGVVGRAMADKMVEFVPIEQLFPSTGVLGNSIVGPGVRGHGGTIFPALSPLNDRCPRRPIGAIFSCGELIDGTAPVLPTEEPQEVSAGAFAQMQLIPSQDPTLPPVAQIGDFFLVIDGDRGARLFVCLRIDGSVAKWKEVSFVGGERDSGSWL